MSVEEELIKLFALYGTIEEYRCMHEIEAEDEYSDVYWIKFSELPEARIAKRKLDDYNFFAKLLRIEYAPQNESIKDTREKLEERKKVISFRLNVLNKKPSSNNNKEISYNETLSFTELPFSAPNDGMQFPKSELEMLPAPNVFKSSGLYRKQLPNPDKRQDEQQQLSQTRKRKTPEDDIAYFPVASMNYAASAIRNKLKKTLAPTVITTNTGQNKNETNTSQIQNNKVSRRRI